MNNRILYSILILLVCAVVAMPAAFGAEKEQRDGKGAAKVMGTPTKTYFNINNISTVFGNDGDADIDIQKQNSGLVFPKGSRKTAMFESGFLWGARYGVGGEVRVGGSAYRQGLQGGKIVGGVAESPDLPKNRIYRVRPDIGPGANTANVVVNSEIADGEGSRDAIIAQYLKDWNEWPATDGAPFTDNNANGTYEAATDVPGVGGADQTIWYVANDLNSSLTTFLYGSNPMGIELQVTIWGYAQGGALGNMLFKKYLMINKSNTTFDSTYVTQWADPDLGNSTDDFAGCDTTRSLGFVYNANAVDDTYKPLPPPASGFDFFQGPLVAGAATDSAIFRGKRVYGKKNLPMTAFYYFTRGDPSVTDPTQGSYEGTTQFYNFMQGRIGKTGEIFKTPEGIPTTFVLSGDPQTRQGWVDGVLSVAGDRRMGIASGPFTMAPGDTQEIAVAEMAAGAIPGTDRLSCIGLLKFYDDQAQLAYNNFFDLPVPPPNPKVSVVELNREIVLNWGGDAGGTAATENSVSKGYAFQGYNVYQLPSGTATLEDAKLIATYDIVDGIGKIEDFVFDPSTGVVAKKVIQFGNDNGIKRFISIKNDEFNGGTPLVNGTRYYYVVTAYSYNPALGAVPNNLESPIARLTVVPHSPNPGVTYPIAFGDTLATVTHAGPSDGGVFPVVVDPSALTGQQYRVTFTAAGGGNTTWSVFRGSSTTPLLSGQTNQNADDTSPIVDGIQFRVIGAPQTFKTFLVTSNASGALDPPEAGSFGFNGSGFPLGPPLPAGTDRPLGTRQQASGLTASQGWGIHTGMTSATMDLGYVNFVSRVTQAGARWSTIIPYDFEMRFTAAGGKALLPTAFGSLVDKLIDVPFELWNVGINTPNDASDDYRMFPNILDVDGSGTFNLLTQAGVDTVDNGTGAGVATHSISGGGNDPFTDWIYWVQPADKSAGQAGYNAIVAGAQTAIGAGSDPYLGAGTDNDVLRRVVLVGWNFGTVASGTYAKQMPETGTVFRIISSKPNTVNDVFTVTVPPVAYSADQAKASIGEINVFPNPYYGVNSQELNKYQRFVTFTHMPAKATVRIFNLAGIMVRRIDKDDTSQFLRWDLANDSGLPVGSGLYVAYIEMPDIGAKKIVKIAVVQEQQVLDRF